MLWTGIRRWSGAVFGTVEYRDRNATNRALPDPRPQIVSTDAGNNPVKQPNTHWGDSYERDLLSLCFCDACERLYDDPADLRRQGPWQATTWAT